MKEHIKNKWVEALRSGEYVQTKNMLKSVDGGFCCLGVLCDIHAQESSGKWEEDDDSGFCYYDHNQEILPYSVRSWAGIQNGGSGEFQDYDALGHARQRCLALMNDSGDYTFDQLADIIEQNWEKL